MTGFIPGTNTFGTGYRPEINRVEVHDPVVSETTRVVLDIFDLRDAVTAADEAAEGASNDEEIEALQNALEIALNLLGFQRDEPVEETEQ